MQNISETTKIKLSLDPRRNFMSTQKPYDSRQTTGKKKLTKLQCPRGSFWSHTKINYTHVTPMQKKV